MKKMLFVTKLIVEATKEEIYIYMSLEDYKKYAFTRNLIKILGIFKIKM